MPQQIFGAEAVVSMVNRALANTSPANTVFQNQVAAAGTTEASQYAFAAQLGAQYAVGKTPAELSALLLGNMGVANEVLESALTDYIAFHGAQNIGVIALQLSQIMSGLEGDATFGAAAAAWNQEVTNAYQYSSSPNNNTPQTGDDGASTTKLSRFTDVLTGKEFTGYLDYNQFTGRDEQTLSTSDRLTGTDAQDDVLYAQLTNTGARPTLNGIEIVSIDAKDTAPTLDLSDANGVKTVINANSNENSNLTFSNLKNLVDVVIKNTNGNTVVGFNGSVVAGVADVLNLALDGAGVKAKAATVVLGNGVTGTGIETLNITASGNASVLGAVTSADLTSLTINGDKDLTVGSKVSVVAANANLTAANNALATANVTLTTAQGAAVPADYPTQAAKDAAIAAAQAAVNQATTIQAGAQTAFNAANIAAADGFSSTKIATVDASAATGNLFLDLVASAGRDQTVTTGTGNDVVVTGTLSATDTFNLGAGNDRLVLATVNSNEAAKLIGVEEVEARAAGTNLNLTNAADVKLLAVAENAGFANVTAVKSGTAVVFEGEGLKNAVSNSTVSFGDVNYNLANANGATDVIDFKFNNAGVALGANSTVVIGALNNTGNNVETINLSFSDLVATNTVTVADINDAALKTLNVTSDSKVVLNLVSDLTKLTSVDASGVKAGFTATFGDLGAAAAATIKLGGSGVNNLTVGKANDTVATAVKLLTVDGSAGTGNQNITISGNTDTTNAPVAADSATNAAAKASVSVLGGSGNDTITVSSNAGTVNLINGGAGADKINLANSAGADVVVLTAGSSNSVNKDAVDTFNSTQGDKFDLSSFGFDVALQGVTSAGTALNGTAAEFGSKAAYFDTNANTLYVDVNGDNKLDANDLVISLTNGTFNVGGIENDILWA